MKSCIQTGHVLDPPCKFEHCGAGVVMNPRSGVMTIPVTISTTGNHPFTIVQPVTIPVTISTAGTIPLPTYSWLQSPLQSVHLVQSLYHLTAGCNPRYNQYSWYNPFTIVEPVTIPVTISTAGYTFTIIQAVTIPVTISTAG